MRIPKHVVATLLLLAAVAIPSQSFAIAISTGSNSVGGLGATANAIVRIAAPAGVGSGTVIDVMKYTSGTSICVLTADHVIRDPSGGGGSLFDANDVIASFGNQGAGGGSFRAHAVATKFDLPDDGSDATDLALIHLFVHNDREALLPGGLAAAALPAASPAANAAITQAGYGLQGGVASVSGNLSYVFSPVNALGAGYGTLAAGPNTVGAGVANIVGAVSDFAGQSYQYQGFQNGATINGANPNYVGSTSYIFSGDSGGPSLVGNSIVGVHSSSVTSGVVGDPNSEVATPANAAHLWQDVDVFSSVGWINDTHDLICTPEPGSFVLLVCGGLLLMLVRYRRAR